MTTQTQKRSKKKNPSVPFEDNFYMELQYVFNQVGAMFFTLDSERQIISSNWVAQLRLEYQAEALQGLPFSCLFPRDIREEISQALKGAEPGKPVILNKNMQALDGTLAPLEVRAFIIDLHGKQDLVCVCSDRSELAYLQDEVRTVRDHLSHYTESSSEFFWTAATDMAGKLTYSSFSPSVERVTGYPAQTFLSGEKEFLSLIHPEDHVPAMEAIQQRIIQGRRSDIEYRIIRPDGSILWMRDRLRNRRIVDNRILLDGVTTNVTSQKQAELTLHQANEQLRLWINELRQRNSEVVFMNEMGDMLQSSITMQNAYNVVSQFAGQIFDGYSGALYILNPDSNMLEIQASWGKNPPGETNFLPDACWAMRRGQVQVVSNPRQKVRCQHVAEKGEDLTYLCVPVVAQTDNLGMLHIRGLQGKSVDHLKQLALLVAGRVALALSNLRLSEILRVQSIRDQLTGLFNRRYMEEMMQREVHRAVRYNRPLGIMMMDIDHFKKYNDTHGHPAADAILRELGHLIQSHIRREDIACRYGGEEFIIIMAEASLQDTRNRAESLRSEIREMTVTYGDINLGGITVSIGVSGFPAHGRTPQELIQAADNALYRAKREGRDRVALAS